MIMNPLKSIVARYQGYILTNIQKSKYGKKLREIKNSHKGEKLTPLRRDLKRLSTHCHYIKVACHYISFLARCLWEKRRERNKRREN